MAVPSLRVRFSRGAAAVSTEHGDLEVSAPGGRLVLRGGRGVETLARRSLSLRAGRRVDFAAAQGPRPPQLRVESRTTWVDAKLVRLVATALELAGEEARWTVSRVVLVAKALCLRAERFERRARRLRQHVEAAFQETTEADHRRAGRLRSLVAGASVVRAGRARLTSSGTTELSGKQVLVG